MYSLIQKYKLYGLKRFVRFALHELYALFFLQTIKQSFSQDKEDLLMSRLIKKQKGFYVDVGAYDPHRFSNTKHFYLKGWRGINIEPDVINYQKFVKDRPHDSNLNIGIGTREATLTFYIFFPDTLSTFSEKSAKQYQKEGFKLAKELKVPVKTLSAILNTYAKKRAIDFLSVDTEGLDLLVLKSNDWKKFRPTVICVETSLPSGISGGHQDTRIEDYLRKMQYKKVFTTASNSIFLDKSRGHEKSVVVVTHEATTGPAHDLRDYLKEKSKNLLFISHPLLYIPANYKKSSYCEFFTQGKQIQIGKAFHFRLPELVLYIKDCIYSMWWFVRIMKHADLYIGVGNINATVGILLKKMGFVNTIIFYCIDYVPVRFSNRVVNAVYHMLDKWAVTQSDATWNLSPRMAEGRKKRWHKDFNNQHVVPHGVHFKRIKRLAFSKINKTELLYMGTLLEKQGIQLALQSLPAVIKKIPTISLTIIGDGPYKEKLITLTKKLHLENFVSFLGYMPNHEEMENRIAQSTVALALYDREADKNDFTYYADPGKIRNYLGAGVPVIMTDTAYIAEEIKKASCGFVISYSEKELTQTLVSFLGNQEQMKTCRKNAARFAEYYDWDNVFTRAFSFKTRAEKK
ncbi:hypothetical protein A3A55_03280 [Candidatus Roizmanbacteria bacterium RIFCSPLOWO2_01_FULL_40_14]|uniref:Uncharacterized protein n=3 Tax=Candidatus Roizmaniibacteriota TaxID=1752723 RepID=A0A0G0XDH9_9BACT|nr:MAG: hypothetical protein UU14_C0001G0035 [Candidatus Roizmanbacteria bacterium GW2011_GWB1_40_7]KKR94922.1 MAG: hypothetical protein UU41_C0002G0043 [Candidatus Roizmanbacteria bacterium GW2011_GWA1_41_13]KKS22994.1 MAG: hypothetical protein UU78_C0007G0012 [Candidatus Roizmanbacteria bacterium GW2011_GWC2_41_7]OGK48723.1 MAG: hypothetical protein A3A55_03280 [Candidatus Roizmanbacteria bacterium RIFCSPLOWO2_01_FULL_40_14]